MDGYSRADGTEEQGFVQKIKGFVQKIKASQIWRKIFPDEKPIEISPFFKAMASSEGKEEIGLYN